MNMNFLVSINTLTKKWMIHLKLTNINQSNKGGGGGGGGPK